MEKVANVADGMDNTYVMILATASSQDEAAVITEQLLEHHLVACVQQLEIKSSYHWKGELNRDDEILLMMKGRADLFAEVEQCILEHHSYEVPEIVCVPLLAGHAPYLRWIDEVLVKQVN